MDRSLLPDCGGGRPVPYATLGGEGFLYAIQPRLLQAYVGGWHAIDALVAASDTRINGTQAIIDSALLPKGRRDTDVQNAYGRGAGCGICGSSGGGASRCSYIHSGETLPAPFPAEEEQAWIMRLKEGEQTARNALIEHNMRLVVYIARKFENTRGGHRGSHFHRTIGLIKAVNTFDPDKKIKLATYASRCIENEILMHLRRANRLKLEVSFDEPLNVDWDGNETVALGHPGHGVGHH